MPGASVEIRGGEALQRRLAEMAERLQSASEVRVGFLENATYPDGTPVALVAVAQNYGTRTLPPRPFMDQMVAEHQDEWPALLEEGLRRSGGDAQAALAFAGQVMVEQLQASILSGNFAPLKPATVARKGFETILVDSAHLLNSVASEVR